MPEPALYRSPNRFPAAHRCGAGDRTKRDQYFDAVRDVERRIHKAEEQSDRDIPAFDQPVGIPDTFEAHSRLMFDLLALAYQTDPTRVGTFMYVSVLDKLGVPVEQFGDSTGKLPYLSEI